MMSMKVVLDLLNLLFLEKKRMLVYFFYIFFSFIKIILWHLQ